MSLLILGCNESREGAFPKSLDQDMANALIAPDSVWDCHCQDAGLIPHLEAIQIVKDAVRTDTNESYLTSRQHLLPYAERLSRCLRDEYKFEGAWTEFQAWSNRTREQAEAISRLKTERLQLQENNDLKPEEKLPRLRRIESEYRATNSVSGVVSALDEQAAQYDALKDKASALACLRRALAEREAGGRHTMTMSLLIEIGSSLSKEDKDDSMLVYYNRSLLIAEDSRDPSSTARALRLLSNYYEQEGQYAAGHELFRESIDRSRNFAGGEDVFGTLFNALNEYAGWGEWDLMGDLLERGDYVLAKANQKAPGSQAERMARDRMAMDFGTFRARRCMMTGHLAEGDSLFQALRKSCRNSPHRQRLAQILYFWSSALLTNGRPQEAASLAKEGLEYADAHNLPPEARQLNLVLADASCQIGDAATANTALERFRSEVAKEKENPYRDLWVIHDRVQVCLALARGDTTGAERAARVGMARLERIIASLDKSAQACLFLDDCREFREAVHCVLSSNAEAGYGFEMAWRGLYKTLGDSNYAQTYFDNGSVTLMKQCAAFGHSLQSRVAKAGAIHAVYFVGSKQTIRWTASPDGVCRELVAAEPSELKKSVAVVTQNLAGKSSNGPETIDALTKLSALLPGAITPKTSAHILVSPDLYLGTLPFEAINIGTRQAYRPLVASCDIAYLRMFQEHTGANPGHGLIVANPSYPSTLSRRNASLGPLPYGEQEATLVAAVYPGSTSLLHEAATKKSFESQWEEANFIYVASHFIRSLDTPYLSFLPLAGPENAPPDKSLLEYSEIRKADLTGCSLVVLSGCGTGAEYTNLQATGPSLGDAFLDAGAHAVIHTRWRVEDKESYDLAKDFIQYWANGENPITALNNAGREAWRRSGGQPSSTWTSYAIGVSEIPSINRKVNHAKRAD